MPRLPLSVRLLAALPLVALAACNGSTDNASDEAHVVVPMQLGAASTESRFVGVTITYLRDVPTEGHHNPVFSRVISVPTGEVRIRIALPLAECLADRHHVRQPKDGCQLQASFELLDELGTPGATATSEPFVVSPGQQVRIAKVTFNTPPAKAAR